jgi:hypothetical protein
MANLNEFLKELNEYVGLIDKGTVDIDKLDLNIMSLDSKMDARRLAIRLKKEAKPEDIKRALELAKEKKNPMAYWFIQALEEVPVKA